MKDSADVTNKPDSSESGFFISCPPHLLPLRPLSHPIPPCPPWLPPPLLPQRQGLLRRSTCRRSPFSVGRSQNTRSSSRWISPRYADVTCSTSPPARLPSRRKREREKSTRSRSIRSTARRWRTS